MDDNNRVLAGLDDLIEVTDRTAANGCSQWAIVPDCFFTFEQKTPDQIGRRKVLMTRDRYQRPIQLVCHVFDKSGLAAACRPF